MNGNKKILFDGAVVGNIITKLVALVIIWSGLHELTLIFTASASESSHHCQIRTYNSSTNNLLICVNGTTEILWCLMEERYAIHGHIPSMRKRYHTWVSDACSKLERNSHVFHRCAHRFVVLCHAVAIYQFLVDLFTHILQVASLAFEKSYACGSRVITTVSLTWHWRIWWIKRYKTTTNHNKTRTVIIIHGIYSMVIQSQYIYLNTNNIVTLQTNG